MDYALLPFSSLSTFKTGQGLPDIRAALESREREAVPGSIHNLELLNHVVEVLRELPWDFWVDHCQESNGRLHLAMMAADLGRNMEVGDRLQAGFFLQNCEQGEIETLVCSRIFRVVCRNGAFVECEEGQSLAIGTTDSPPVDWKCGVRDIIHRSFSAEGLDIDLARFRVTTQQMVVAPYELLCHLVAQGLISDEEQCLIQSAFDEEGDYSMYGFINAVTQVAHGLRDNDDWIRAFRMERLGGEILRGDHRLPAMEPAYSR